MSTKLSLRIHRVTCIDETGGKYVERIGNDEIYLGGFAVNDKAETVEIKPVSIYPHFDDGDSKVFNPPKIFHTFPLPNAKSWGPEPKGFGIGLVLIERDTGKDFSSAITKITEFAKKKIAEKLEEEKKKREEKKKEEKASKLAGAVLTPLIIAAIKLAAPYIVDFAKRQLLRGLRDEVFLPQEATIEISSPNHAWSGSKDSVEKTVHFREHGGHYALVYDWLLS